MHSPRHQRHRCCGLLPRRNSQMSMRVCTLVLLPPLLLQHVQVLVRVLVRGLALPASTRHLLPLQAPESTVQQAETVATAVALRTHCPVLCWQR